MSSKKKGLKGLKIYRDHQIKNDCYKRSKKIGKSMKFVDLFD